MGSSTTHIARVTQTYIVTQIVYLYMYLEGHCVVLLNREAVKQDGVSMLEARALKRTVTYICTTAEVRNALAYVFLKCQTRAMKFIQQQA